MDCSCSWPDPSWRVCHRFECSGTQLWPSSSGIWPLVDEMVVPIRTPWWFGVPEIGNSSVASCSWCSFPTCVGCRWSEVRVQIGMARLLCRFSHTTHGSVGELWIPRLYGDQVTPLLNGFTWDELLLMFSFWWTKMNWSSHLMCSNLMVTILFPWVISLLS